jgi:hypothetical protein
MYARRDRLEAMRKRRMESIGEKQLEVKSIGEKRLELKSIGEKRLETNRLAIKIEVNL